MGKNREKKHKTSISINAALWESFDQQIKPRLGVRDFSPALEILIASWLKREVVPDKEQIPSTELCPTEYGKPPDISSTLAPYEGRPFDLLARILAEAPLLVKEALLANLEAFALFLGGSASGEDFEDAKSPSGIGGINKALQNAKSGYQAAKKRAAGDASETPKRRKA